MSKPLISVIMTAYNAEEFIEKKYTQCFRTDISKSAAYYHQRWFE